MVWFFRNKAIAIAVPPAQAVYTVTVDQVGSDVVATGKGTIDLTGLNLLNNLTVAAAGTAPAVAGLIPTTFVWTWGTGNSHPESFILDIVATPEPGTLTLLAAGLASLGVVLRFRRTSPDGATPAATLP